MKKAAVLAVFALIAVVSATKLSMQWTEKCSKEFNISKEMFDNLDPLVGEWDNSTKCYIRCELLEQNVFEEDAYHYHEHLRFYRPFSRTVGSRLRFKDPALKAGADVLGNCIRTNPATDQCDEAYQFAKCTAGTVVTADFLKEFIAKQL